MFFFKMVYVSGIVTNVKFIFPDHFLVHVILSRVISLFMLIFLYRFLFGNFSRGCFTSTICIMYNVYISQEYKEAWYVYWAAMRYCVMLHFRSYCLSNLYDVWTSTAVLTFFFYISHISQTIWHRYWWYHLLNILAHFCHFKFQFSFFVHVMIKL